MMRQIAIIILEALLISTSALAIDFGHSPPPEPTAAPATDTPGDENIDESSTALVDPTSDDDADGKTYDEETILGTDPEVFNLFSETHYPGFAEITYGDKHTDPWTFYTQALNGPPANGRGCRLR